MHRPVRREPERLTRAGNTPALAAISLFAMLLAPGSATAKDVLSVGDRAPEFEFQGSDDKTYSLQSLRAGGKRGIVLAFFPKAFTPG
jgi:hypothetical protein